MFTKVESMEKPSITWNVNLGTVIPVFIALISAAIWVNTELTELRVRVNGSEQARQDRTEETNKKFTDLTTTVRANEGNTSKLAQIIDNLSYRMGQTEASVSATNARMDRLTDSLLSSVDGLKKDVGSVNVQVQLLGQKLDSLDVPRSPLKRSVMPPWCAGYTLCPPLKIGVQEARLAPLP